MENGQWTMDNDGWFDVAQHRWFDSAELDMRAGRKAKSEQVSRRPQRSSWSGKMGRLALGLFFPVN
jgi:hypothetical protein